MVLPEPLGEEFVHEVVRRILDHLDLFDDHLLLALDVIAAERRVAHDIRKDVDGQRQVLVQDLDVVAGVFLGRKSVELAAYRVDLLGYVLGCPRGGALEQHVLDKMRDAALFRCFMPGAAGQPDADTDRPHLSHPLGQDPKAVIENVSDDR